MKKIILASKSPRRLEILRAHGFEPIVIPSNTEEILPEEIGMEDAVKLLAYQKAEACFNCIEKAMRSNNADKGGLLRLPNSPITADMIKDFIIIGADTIVYKDEIMGKPADESDAFRMLDKIRNTHHYVVTGVCMIPLSNISISDTESPSNDASASGNKSIPSTFSVRDQETASRITQEPSAVGLKDESNLIVLSDVTKVFCKEYTDDDIRNYIASGEPMDKAGAYAIQGGFGQYIDHIEGDYENVVGLPFHRIKAYL